MKFWNVKTELLGQFQIKPLKIVKFNGVKNVYRSNGDAEHNQINILGQHTGQIVGGRSNVGEMNNGANSGYIGDNGSLTNSAYATKTSQPFTDANEPDNDTSGTMLTEINDQGMVRKWVVFKMGYIQIVIT